MKKKISELSSWALSLIPLVILAVLIIYTLASQSPAGTQATGVQTPEERLVESDIPLESLSATDSSPSLAGTQETGILDLEKRLVALGIPLKSLTVTNPSPLEIEVVLMSTGNGEKASPENGLHEMMMEREIELAYLNYGVSIQAYHVSILSTEGEKFFKHISYLHPTDPSQQLTKAAPSAVGHGETKDILANNIDLHGLKLLALDVPASYTSSDNSKLVTLEVSTGTSIDQTDDRQIESFILSLQPQMEALNDRYGAGIVIVQALIKDADGRLLINFVQDVQLWKEKAWMDEKVTARWFPEPAVNAEGVEAWDTPTPTATRPTAAPFPTPDPLLTPTFGPTGYPAPQLDSYPSP